MTYPTDVYPPWGSIEPDPNEHGAGYVYRAVAAARDLFDWNHDMHEPECDAFAAVKCRTAYAAAAIVDEAGSDDPTWGDVAAVQGDRAADLAHERGVADEAIEANEVAIGVYAAVVAGLDWGADEANRDKNTLVFVHDGARDLASAGNELWPDADASEDGETA